MWKKIILVMVISTVILSSAAGVIFADSDSWGESSNLITEGGKVKAILPKDLQTNQVNVRLLDNIKDCYKV